MILIDAAWWAKSALLRSALPAVFLLAITATSSQGCAQSIDFSRPVRTPAQWPLGRFQARLDDRLKTCGLSGIKVDQWLGSGTVDGIRRLGRCPSYGSAGAANGRITPDLWHQVMAEPFPSVAERAQTLTYNFEGTDYTAFLWNVGQPADPHAFGTWGPFGATLAQGGEIQRILRMVSQAPAGLKLIEAAYEQARAGTVHSVRYNWRAAYCAGRADMRAASGQNLLLGLSVPLTRDDRAQLSSAFCDDAEYWVWPDAFLILGQKPEIRSAYDAYYHDQNRRIVRALAELYVQLGFPITEIDWAFFLDRATQFSTDIAKARSALKALPASSTPAMRRLAVSRASRPSSEAQKRLRVGRDMAFIAASSPGLLDAFESSAWRYVGMLSAEQLGLSDGSVVKDNPY